MLIVFARNCFAVLILSVIFQSECPIATLICTFPRFWMGFGTSRVFTEFPVINSNVVVRHYFAFVHKITVQPIRQQQI
jgi:hypothetical protein